MQGRRVFSFSFRSSRMDKVLQQLNTGPSGWLVIFLSVTLYYLIFFSQVRPDITMAQIASISIFSLIPNVLAAILKARKGALIGSLLLLPSTILCGYFSNGASGNLSALVKIISETFPIMLASFGMPLAIGHFRLISSRLDTAYSQLRKTHNDLANALITIQKQALTDALTGLPNHRAVVDQLQYELEHARHYGNPFSVLFFDADHFKQVNDTYGHVAGDAVLCEIGKRAGSVLRGGDILGRFGGEEFVILLPQTDTCEAAIVAERIRTVVATGSIAVPGVEEGIAMTVSIGIATYPTDGTLEQNLLSQADEAMYLAKKSGRNQVRTAEETRHISTNLEVMVL